MLPDKPEDWEARFVTKSGETLVGRDRIRKVVGGMIEAKARLHSRVVKERVP